MQSRGQFDSSVTRP
nr:unnamed protein product [Callosobruchus chinensis]